MTISTVLAWVGYFYLFFGVPAGVIRALVDKEQRAQGMRLAVRSLVAFVVLLVAAYIAALNGF
jgi:hypothetical protein